ncbi:MAG: hypothetical protein JRJ47_14000, partial [Deltaproteobacteria bacterium]|nr:hypothetical protein [Deltaproteobacteria bacterium]
MIKLTKRFIPVLGIIFLLVNCGESGPTITDNEVIVKTGSMDVHFSRVKPFAETYLIFGGAEMKQRDAITKVSLSGLEINTARFIHSRYPDFYACKSPGASLAQKALRQLDIVPADSKVMEDLRKTLADHQASLQQSGKRVCVRLEGEVLKLSSAIIRENNQDVTNEL